MEYYPLFDAHDAKFIGWLGPRQDSKCRSARGYPEHIRKMVRFVQRIWKANNRAGKYGLRSKVALEHLYHCGDLMIEGRSFSGFTICVNVLPTWDDSNSTIRVPSKR